MTQTLCTLLPYCVARLCMCVLFLYIYFFNYFLHKAGRAERNVDLDRTYVILFYLFFFNIHYRLVGGLLPLT